MFSTPRTNSVILIQVDVQKYDELDALKDKIEAGKNLDGSTIYVGRKYVEEDMCE